MNLNDSVMAKRDMASKDDDHYYDGTDSIFCVTIGSVLRSLDSDSEFYKEPTRAGLQKALKKQLESLMDDFSDDWDFYAREVIPKFIVGVMQND